MNVTTSSLLFGSDFLETFFSAEEDRRRHSFLARNSIHVLEATDPSVIKMRIAQSAIPEISDACLLVLHTENGNWEKPVAVHRYEEEEAQLQTLRRLPPTFIDCLECCTTLRVLTPAEITTLKEYLPNLVSGVIAPFGKPGSPFGYCVFFQTLSGRTFLPTQLGIIRELVLYSEHVILHSQAAESLRREIRAREKFISIASHELKTPVTALKLQIDVLRRNFRREGAALSPDKIENSFTTLDLSIHRLTQSIEMLFNLSEIRTGQIGLLKAPADLAQLIQDVLSRMESVMKSAGCIVVADIPEKLPAFFDARRIEQALINLLANASKYAPGTRVEVQVSSNNEKATIDIRDGGPGISFKDQAKIFEAFKRGKENASTEGLGLGLFVTQGVVRAHGGTLSLTSNPGAGACFSVTIPLWQA